MRCEVHGLAAAPDGRCVLCRRAAARPTRFEPWLVLGGIATVLAACLMYRAASALTATAGHAPGDTGSEAPSTPARSGQAKVVVYTTSWCSVCRRAKKWMTDQGIAYEEHDVESSPQDARHLHAISPRGAVPTFEVDGKVIVGFAEHEITSALRGR